MCEDLDAVDRVSVFAKVVVQTDALGQAALLPGDSEGATLYFPAGR